MNLTPSEKRFGYGATVGYLFYLGLFTVIGAVAMLFSIGWIIAAVVFAVALEGAVYANNIFKGIENANAELVLKHDLAANLLNELKKEHANNELINTYFKKKKYLHDLHQSDQQNVLVQAEIENTKKFLTQLEAVIIEYLDDATLESNDTTKQQIINYIKPLIKDEDRTTFTTTTSSRSSYMHVGKYLSVASGSFSATSAAAVIYSQLTSHTAIAILLKIGITTATATAAFTGIIVFSIAALVLIGSSLVMYGTVSENIKKGGLDGWLVKMNKFLNLKQDEIYWNYLKKGILYLFIGFLVIFSTAATIYSFFAPIFSPPIKFISTILLKIIIAILALASFVLTFIFNAENTLTSLLRMKEAIAEGCQTIRENWRNSQSCFGFITKFDAFKDDSTWLQVLNPFRLANQLILAGHAYGIGLSADDFPYISPMVVSIFTGAMEWVTDFHYATASSKQVGCVSNQPKPLNVSLDADFKDGNSKIQEKEEEDHEHEHGSLPQFITTLFNWLAAIWDYLAGPGSQKWQNSKNKFFPPSQEKPTPPTLNLVFVKHHFNSECDEQIAKYESQVTKKSGMSSLSARKVGAFKELKTDFDSYVSEAEKADLLTKQEYASLGEHRHSFRLFPSTLPTSFQSAQAILKTAKQSLNNSS